MEGSGTTAKGTTSAQLSPTLISSTNRAELKPQLGRAFAKLRALTVVVERERRVNVPKYERLKHVTHKYLAHSRPCLAANGDYHQQLNECKSRSILTAHGVALPRGVLNRIEYRAASF